MNETYIIKSGYRVYARSVARAAPIRIAEEEGSATHQGAYHAHATGNAEEKDRGSRHSRAMDPIQCGYTEHIRQRRRK